MGISELAWTLASPVWHFLVDEYTENPWHLIIHGVLLLFLAYFALRKPQKLEKDKLTDKEIDALVAEWEPEPLSPIPSERARKLVHAAEENAIESVDGSFVTIKGRKVLSASNHNFLGLLANPDISERAKACVEKYGCGSCGPRGFYGSIDTHIHFEEDIARFMGTEEAILYSYGFSTIASAIPAFAKRTDLIICDEAVAFAVQTGVQLSRSNVKYFKHNDMADLERIMQEVEAADGAQKKGKLYRKFVVTEGVFQNTGTICNLPALVDLKNRYRYRLIVEETYSFGFLGKTGRGVTEYYNISINELLFMTASVGMSLAAVGGFCAGSHEVVSHQRLSGSGYCYSASLPPFLSHCASAALQILADEPHRCTEAQNKAHRLRTGLARVPGLRLLGPADCPVALVAVAEPRSREEDEDALDAIAAHALENGVAIARAKFNCNNERVPPVPTLRIFPSYAHTDENIDLIISVVSGGAAAVFGDGAVESKGKGEAANAAAGASRRAKKAH